MRATPREIAEFEQEQWERMQVARVYSSFGEWYYFNPPDVTWDEVIRYLGYFERRDEVARVQFYRDEGDWPDLLRVYGTFLSLTPTSMKPSYHFGHQFHPDPERIDEKGRLLLSFFGDNPPYDGKQGLRKWEMVNLMKHFVEYQKESFFSPLFSGISPTLCEIESAELLAW